MRSQRVRLLFIAPIAIVLLAACVSTATAEMLRFNPGGAVTMRGPITFRAGERQIRCNVTFAGTLTERLVEATSGVQVGAITGTTMGTCEGGRLTWLRPAYPLRFVSLLRPAAGVLATSEELGILEENIFAENCLFGALMGFLIGPESLTILSEPLLRLARSLEGSLFCQLNASITGTLAMSPRQQLIVV
jgi:hypothetical protein